MLSCINVTDPIHSSLPHPLSYSLFQLILKYDYLSLQTNCVVNKAPELQRPVQYRRTHKETSVVKLN